MPFILIIIGVIAALGLGGYLWNSQKNEEVPPVAAEVTTSATIPETAEPTTPSPVITTSTTTTTTETTTAYKNGTYTADVTYKAPDQLTHPVQVTLTLTNDVVTASEVTFGAESNGTTAVRQKSFAATYKTLVIGKPITSINLSRVGGSSLTTNAWNNAKEKIEAEAKTS